MVIFNSYVKLPEGNTLGDLVASVGPDASAAGQTSVQNLNPPQATDFAVADHFGYPLVN